MNLLNKIQEYFERNSTKFYLIIANIILVIFGIWFSNVGLLPFLNKGDFFIFIILSLMLGLYRPSWMFAFFIGALALENINLAPKAFGFMLRPYQLFGFITLLSLLSRHLMKRLSFTLPQWKWFDGLILVFGLAGIVSGIFSANRSMSLKQAIIIITFIALYFLARIYIQTLEDFKRILPFFLSSALVVIFYGIWQNIAFLKGQNSFEVMPGRPNSTFPEPDWLGIYLTFILALLFGILYLINRELNKNKFRLIGIYLFLLITCVSLILTVSRSAWLGAVLVTLGFLKVALVDGTLNWRKWQWKKFGQNVLVVFVILILSSIFASKLTRFQIFNRAQSTGGQQKITIACQTNVQNLPSEINDVNDLDKYGCRHINLEDIEKEKTQGNYIYEIFRKDPTVSIRSQIYQKSILQIKKHPFVGIGWGSISKILGNDERGAGLNASNIFLEIWLGSGIVGLFSFVLILLWIFIRGCILYLNKGIEDKTFVVLVLLAWTAIIIPNLFNSGIFLGFLWVYLAISVSLLINIKE